MNGKRDWNRNSGNDPKKLTEVEKRAEEIIHGKKDDGTETCPDINLQTFCLGKTDQHQSDLEEFIADKPGSSTPAHHDDSGNAVTPRSTPRQREITGRYKFKPKSKHGTGSNIAKTKLQLEQQ